jgi:ABC-type multidrug transport system ATPase subunit
MFELSLVRHAYLFRQSLVPGPNVGYMPQELALYGEFTIKETLQYFGRCITS